MMKICKQLFAISLLSVVWNHGWTSPGSKDERFYIVDGVYKVIKRNDLPSNVFPWELPGAGKSDGKFNGDVITVVHGCDFFDFEYFLYESNKAGEVISVRAQPGEFCDLRDLVFAHPTLIKVKFWKGVGYLLESAPLILDEHDKAYIAGIDLPESWGLNRLLEPAKEDRIFCRSKESLSPRFVEFMLSSKYISEVDGMICHSFVLPVDRIR